MAFKPIILFFQIERNNKVLMILNAVLKCGTSFKMILKKENLMITRNRDNEYNALTV